MDINQIPSNGNQPNNEPPVEPATETKTKLGTRTLILGIAGLAVLAAGIITLTSLKPKSSQPQAPATQTADTSALPPSQPAQSQAPQLEEDSTVAISQQLNNIVVTDLDSQFQSIDADLNSL